MIKKLVRYLSYSVAVMLIIMVSLVYYYQDAIVQRFIATANQYINTPVRVEKISVSMLDQFPFLSIQLDSIYIGGSILAENRPFARAEKLYFTFNPLALLKGEYIISKVHLEHADIYIYNDTQTNNYQIFKAQETVPSSSSSPLLFRLKQISLEDVHVTYHDPVAKQEHQLLAREANAALQVHGNQYQIGLMGNLLCEGIRLDQDIYFKNKLLDLDAAMLYDHDLQNLNIAQSDIRIGKGRFSVTGDVNYKNTNTADLAVTGKETDLQTLVSLLPEQLAKSLSAYRSQGSVYLSGIVRGEISSTHNPLVKVDFGCQQASFYHPDYQKSLENVELTGYFTNGPKQNLKTSELVLRDIQATLDHRPVTGHFSLKNFERYFIDCQVKGEQDINALLSFYPVPEVLSASGMVKADFSIQGSLKDLQNPHAYRQNIVRSTGDISFDQLALQLNTTKLPLHELTGNLMFKNNDIALNNVSGYMGSSHFMFNGFFRNALAYVLTDHQYINIQADMHSAYLDMDELLSDQLGHQTSQSTQIQQTQWNENASKQPYHFSIDPRLVVDFSCQVDKLKFRRLKAHHIAGNLKLRQKQAEVSNLSMQTAGGQLRATTHIDARPYEQVLVQSDLHLKDMHLDSLFYIFEDFDQQFLTAKHLAGTTDSDIRWKLQFDRELHLNYPTLEAEIMTSIKHGELNNFEPMQSLSRFMDSESLAHLQFDEMRNYIKIADQTISLPRMLVRNNVTDIYVEGTHTFGNLIDYRFEVPMSNISIRSAAARKRAYDRARAFGEIAKDTARPITLFLKAQGSVDDYKITYDMPAAQAQFRENLHNEKKELKEVFENKGQKQGTKIELSEAEFFDF